MVRADLTNMLGSVSRMPSSGSRADSAKRVIPASEPLYASYLRKETRLREEQQNGLTLLARRLSRAKGSGGERITENTLIRVAIDLLLARSTQLAGQDEAALRRSVDLP